MNAAVTSAVPELDVDPFSDEFLTDPYAHHVQLREAGALFRLSRYGIWGMARHAEVSSALQDFSTFCSGRGAGLTDFVKEKPWRPPSIILEADPPLHTRTRGVLGKVLSRPALARLKDNMAREAEALLDEVLTRSHFDAVPALAQAFPLRVFPDAVGLVREGRENLLPYGDMAFNAFGPRNALFEASMRKAAEVTAWIVAQCRREALSPDGFGAQIYAEVDNGTISEQEAGLLVRSLLTAGLDTTIHGIGHALHCFVAWPDQWRALRRNPARVREAFEEVLRFVSPVQTFFRTTTRDVEVAGHTIPEGEKVLLFLAAANRDPRRWEEAERFDTERDASGHVSFGYGIHQCVGQMVARMEAETLLGALAKRVESFELDGAAAFRLNNTLRSLESLPVRVSLHGRVNAATAARVPVRAAGDVLELRIARRVREAEDICSFELVAVDGGGAGAGAGAGDGAGAELPEFTAGAHIDVTVREGLTRQYSLCGDPADRSRYRIAVLREPVSRGGSIAIHDEMHEGKIVRVSAPKNHFALARDARRSLLLAAGIGITPILAMAQTLAREEADFELHYCTRSPERMAFHDRIRRSPFASRVSMYFSAAQRLDVGALLAAAPRADTHLYVCGPKRFMDAVLAAARAQGWPESQLHYEFFAAEVIHSDSDTAFEVKLARSGRVIKVTRERTVLQALADAGVAVPSSCEQGVCGTCLTRVLQGVPDHRDLYLTPDERAANDQFTPCCSRAKSATLVLDL
jgi:cytochrome P450/ferredoxin-NADP reductase